MARRNIGRRAPRSPRRIGPFTTASRTRGMRVLAATAKVAQTSITSIWREYGRT